jgi:hypothetical protein
MWCIKQGVFLFMMLPLPLEQVLQAEGYIAFKVSYKKNVMVVLRPWLRRRRTKGYF